MSLSAGGYAVIALDGNGCSDTASFEVVEPEELVVIVDEVVDQTEGLSNGSISITVTGGTLNYAFDWSGLSGAYASNDEDIDGLLAGDYNVAVVDANGCVASVDGINVNVVVGMDDLGIEAFRIWPNPAVDVLTIQWPQAFVPQGASLDVFNAMGQRVATLAISQGVERTELFVGDWASGRYTVRFTAERNVVAVPLVILH
jgi:hypothetical protein